MATLQSVKLHIAGHGHVFYADVDEAPMNVTQFQFGVHATYGGWVWLGDTSSENLVAFESEGGDTTFKRTWDRSNVRAVSEDESITMTINSVNVSKESFDLGFAGHDYDAATGSYGVGTSSGTTQKAIMVVMSDGTVNAALYTPNVDLKGSFPQFDLEEFTEIPLTGAVLGSLTQTTPGAGQLAWRWFEPREFTAA